MRPGTLSPGLTPLKRKHPPLRLAPTIMVPSPQKTKKTPPATSSLLDNLCPSTIETHPVPSGPSGRARYEIVQQMEPTPVSPRLMVVYLKVNKSHATNETHTCPVSHMVVYVMKPLNKRNPFLRLRAPWSCTQGKNTSAGHYAHQLPSVRHSTFLGSSAYGVRPGMVFPLSLGVFEGSWA